MDNTPLPKNSPWHNVRGNSLLTQWNLIITATRPDNTILETLISKCNVKRTSPKFTTSLIFSFQLFPYSGSLQHVFTFKFITSITDNLLDHFHVTHNIPHHIHPPLAWFSSSSLTWHSHLWCLSPHILLSTLHVQIIAVSPFLILLPPSWFSQFHDSTHSLFCLTSPSKYLSHHSRIIKILVIISLSKREDL